ncbi:MAG: single-stranded DNA-binding protein [Chitinophagaceae bacterium]
MNIIGRLTKDAEIRSVAGDRQVVNFSIASNDSYRNKQGERIEQTTYFDCAYWITTKVAQYLTKGTLVALTGRVSARAWVGKDGEAYAGLNFHASQIELHGGGRKNGNAAAQDAGGYSETPDPAPYPYPVDDLPF